MVITFKNVSFQYTDIPLLENINLSITDSNKVGLVGLNGAGKSTLFKLIIGDINPTKGEIIISGNTVINYLPQNPIIPNDISCYSYVFKDSKDINEYEINSILTKFKLDPKGLTNNLSGGEKRRLALAKCLVSYSDFLLLDEPTNHLDNDMILFLEKYLKRFNHGLFLITHDRYFLERVCNTMLELDNTSIYSYNANYSLFLELKAERLEREAKEEKKLKSILRTELEWMNRGVEARRTKQKSRIERFKELSKIKFAKRESFEFESINTYLGKKIIEIKNASKAYGDKKLFDNFNLSLLRTSHIGITGDNGCGKTTLFKTIMGLETLDSGSIELGETLNIGYFSQNFDEIDPEIRVIDYIKNETDEIETLDGTLDARSLLEKFLFDSKMQYSLVKTLSGGQKRRLQLVRVLAKNPNILLLDEPTNDLDIYTIEILENYLNSFMGPILCISHDRYFLDKICDELLYFNSGSINTYYGLFSDFLEENFVEKPQEIKHEREKRVRVSMTFAEKKELEELEKRIPVLEKRMKEINDYFIANTSNYIKILELQKELEGINTEYEEKSMRYLELLEKKELVG